MATKSARSSSGSSEGRVGATAKIRGRVSGDGSLVVEGRIEGNVTLRGELTIAEGGVVSADVIEAESIDVSGNLDGEMRITGQLRAGQGANVRGNVTGGAVVLEEGAHFDGRIDNEFSLPAELEGGAERPRRR